MLAIFPISTGYELLGLLHILAVVIAFGPLFFYASCSVPVPAQRSPSCTSA